MARIERDKVETIKCSFIHSLPLFIYIYGGPSGGRGGLTRGAPGDRPRRQLPTLVSVK
jgi:hypothetical protein